jgi:hypothetical protein
MLYPLGDRRFNLSVIGADHLKGSEFFKSMGTFGSAIHVIESKSQAHNSPASQGG